jgi:hypothetical protein
MTTGLDQFMYEVGFLGRCTVLFLFELQATIYHTTRLDPTVYELGFLGR